LKVRVEVEAVNDLSYTAHSIVGAVQLLSRLSQRWKSQRNKIHRLTYRFSIDFSLLGLAYGFLSKSPRYFLATTNV
jgi:hypothetical protein